MEPQIERAKATLEAHFAGYQHWDRIFAGLERGYFPVFLKYPVWPRPRFGHGQPPYPQFQSLFETQKGRYRTLLERFLTHRQRLLAIPREAPEDSPLPRWNQPWFSHLDGVALYCLLAQRRPQRFLEIGSGHSTRFARRAIADFNLPTQLISIDPHPRADIDHLCDRMIRSPLEETDLSIFDQLQGGDILFFDGSHRCFMNSDVTVFFLEVLPRTPAGLLWHIHDIYLPEDYPPDRAEIYESEQYVLAAALLAGAQRYHVVLPCRYAVLDPSLAAVMQGFWDELAVDIPARSCSMWLENATAEAACG